MYEIKTEDIYEDFMLKNKNLSLKAQNMCNKAVNIYPSIIKFVFECYKTPCFLYLILFLMDMAVMKCMKSLLTMILLC